VVVVARLRKRYSARHLSHHGISTPALEQSDAAYSGAICSDLSCYNSPHCHRGAVKAKPPINTSWCSNVISSSSAVQYLHTHKSRVPSYQCMVYYSPKPFTTRRICLAEWPSRYVSPFPFPLFPQHAIPVRHLVGSGGQPNFCRR
jgi:hypothetical protein